VTTVAAAGRQTIPALNLSHGGEGSLVPRATEEPSKGVLEASAVVVQGAVRGAQARRSPFEEEDATLRLPVHKVYALEGLGRAGEAAVSGMTPRRGGMLREAMSCITPRSDARLEQALSSMEMRNGDHVRVMRSGVVIRFSADPRLNPQIFFPPENRLNGVDGNIDCHAASWKVRSP